MYKQFISIDIYSNEIGSSLRISIPTKPCYILVNANLEEKGLLSVLINFFNSEKTNLKNYRLNVLFASVNQMDKLIPDLLSNFSLPISKGLSSCKSLGDLFSYGDTPHVLINVTGKKVNSSQFKLTSFEK